MQQFFSKLGCFVLRAWQLSVQVFKAAIYGAIAFLLAYYLIKSTKYLIEIYVETRAQIQWEERMKKDGKDFNTRHKTEAEPCLKNRSICDIREKSKRKLSEERDRMNSCSVKHGR